MDGRSPILLTLTPTLCLLGSCSIQPGGKGTREDIMPVQLPYQASDEEHSVCLLGALAGWQQEAVEN